MMYQYHYFLVLSLLTTQLSFCAHGDIQEQEAQQQYRTLGRSNSGIFTIINNGLPAPQISDNSILPTTWGGRLKLATLVASGGYFYFLYHILSTHTLLDESARWHQWQSDMPLKNLLAQPVDRLKADLEQAILERSHDAAVSDPQKRYRLFCEELDQELEKLQKFVWIVDGLKKNAYLRILFPLNGGKVRQAREAHHKLIFMKSLGRTLYTDGRLITNKTTETSDT